MEGDDGPAAAAATKGGETARTEHEQQQHLSHPISAAAVKTPQPPPHSSSSATKSSNTYTLDHANEELSQLIFRGKITSDDVPAVKTILKEHVSLKEKVEKLKSLLGRSAKAQREAKIDAEASQKRLTQALREMERLQQKLDKLQTRPSHLDLLMDFETNFDKALLSVGQQQQQSGGQETSASRADHGGSTTSPDNYPNYNTGNNNNDNLDSLLLQELGEAKTRIEKLETLNSAMMSRSTQSEKSTQSLQKERDEARDANSRLHMELRMAQLEAEQAQRAMMDKVASLEEMQLEIDCMAKASLKANVRAAKGEEAAHSLKSEKQYIQQLESQVQALKEWATASSEAKQLMQERCRILETKLKQQQGLLKAHNNSNLGLEGDEDGNGGNEKVLFTKNGSKVVGAGDTGHLVLSLGGDHAMSVDARFVVLRWKFDSSPADLTVEFNILKGKCESSSEQARAEYLIKDRVITGGAAGETEGAFNGDEAACTLVWSNAKSWIRPRTVKYSLEVIALK